MRTTLICEFCRMMQGEVYRIDVSGVGDVMMCGHVVESVVRIHRVVEERSPEEAVASRH